MSGKETLVWTVVAFAVFIGIGFILKDMDKSNPKISENPFDDVYQTTFYTDNGSWDITSKNYPVVKGHTVIISNYWYQQWDEEGNEEWTRNTGDTYYQMVIPLHRVYAVESRYILDVNNTAHTVKLWTWDMYDYDMED